MYKGKDEKKRLLTADSSPEEAALASPVPAV